jgi:hypothetical protein
MKTYEPTDSTPSAKAEADKATREAQASLDAVQAEKSAAAKSTDTGDDTYRKNSQAWPGTRQG